MEYSAVTYIWDIQMNKIRWAEQNTVQIMKVC